MRNYKFLKALFKLRMQELMVFRMGFFGPFFVDGSMFILQLLAFDAIYSNVDSIGGWGRGEMIIFIGTFSLLNAVNMVIYFFGANSIPDKIFSGEMDLYITKPVNPLLRISLEKINPGSIPLVIMSIVIIVYGVTESGIELSFGRIAGYIGLVIIMQILYYDMEILLRTIAFFTISINNVSRIEDAGLTLCMKLPGITFYGIYKIIFYIIIPYGIMATFPVQQLIGELDAGGFLFGFGIVTVFTILTMKLWKVGLKHYNSASS